MVKHQSIQGYENFLKFVDDFKNDHPVFVLFTGTKLDTGVSWCPDCVEADPFVEDGFKNVPNDVELIVCEVGDRAFWKNLNCPFRTNLKTSLKVLPTLVRWGTQRRLEGDQLLNSDLIEMLIESSDDD